MRTAGRTLSWRGFERAPHGCLIHQLIDLEPAMGIAYERSLSFYKAPHVHDRVILVFPRGGSSMDVTTTRDGKRHRITRAEGLVVPAGIEHDDRAVSNVYDTLALLPSDELVEKTVGRREKTRARRSPFAACATFARSPWLETLLEEYFAERILGRQSSMRRSAHLEALILLEVFEAVDEPQTADADLRHVRGPTSLVARALRYIEANLFSPLDLERLSATVGASRSSLLRHFRAETGLTPLAYVRARRLDEAKVLLGRGEHNVSEVARLVGYTSLTAFSDAFRARFGASPSAHASREA